MREKWEYCSELYEVVTKFTVHCILRKDTVK